jgi:hypothetical protein
MAGSGTTVSDIAPDVITQEEATSEDNAWSILVWGQPGVGKSHFLHTCPDPLVVIDTEKKAQKIAHKFTDKEVYLFQPDNFEESLDALHQGLDILDHFRYEEDTIGTIGVDSMTDMWEWAQRAYARQYYPTTDDFADAQEQFTTGFGKGESDWKIIKEMHNGKLREMMVDTPYHLCWTAQSKDDYAAAIEDDVDRQKPDGEKKNEYQADTVLHIEEDDQGIPVGSLEKCGLVKNGFRGLYYPTFEEVVEIVEDIDQAETSSEGIDRSEVTDYDVEIVTGNPRYRDD